MIDRTPGETPARDTHDVEPAGLRCYRLFGFTMETSFCFQTPLLATEAAPDFHFQVCRENEPREWLESANLVFESPVRIEGGLPLFTLHRGPRGDLLRFTEVVEFYLSDREIIAYLLDPQYAFMVEIHLLGVVLSYWLERRGIPVLHASAVSVADRAVGFVGSNEGGKSSLAVALMLAGHPLLTDDLIGLQFSASGMVARPGFPSMRMWPDLASHVLGEGWVKAPLAHPRYDKLRVAIGPGGFGQFEAGIRPLACLYLPQRQDPGELAPDVRIDAVPPQEAIFTLLHGSFLPRVTQAAGLTPGRLEVIGNLVERVPVRHLIYPSGFEHLSLVAERVLQDLESLQHFQDGAGS